MKNKIRIKSVLTLIAVVLTAAVLSAVAATAAYDPSADAVVMVSGLLKYTEETIKPAINTAIAEQIKPVQDSLSSVKDKLTAAEAKLAENEAKLAELEEKLAQSTPAAPAVTSSWEVIYLTTGQTLLATAPCAIILRAGAAAVVSPFNGQDGSSPQGLSDLTEGADILSGTPLSPNHHILIPRGNDGRGIQITSEGGAYIMVQGGYTVVE
ncbi:MAG: hypothetical protein E7654_06580 [Ruminococcaceae bacterium]|nr:hypothetical protein [Oscillospiraceae bacterium]